MSPFTSWQAFEEFCREVRGRHRYVPSPTVRAFLEALTELCPDRTRFMRPDTNLWRAQLGCALVPTHESAEVTVQSHRPHPPERMVPDRKHVRLGGRANPSGVAYLYMADTKETAIAEVRPWVGAWVTVARFKARRELKILDLESANPWDEVEAGEFKLQDDPPPEHVAAVVWLRINEAFSRPVAPSDTDLDYVPTQYIAEFVRELGFDGLLYKSALDGGSCVMLFNPADGTLEDRELVKIDSVEWKHRTITP